MSGGINWRGIPGFRLIFSRQIRLRNITMHYWAQLSTARNKNLKQIIFPDDDDDDGDG